MKHLTTAERIGRTQGRTEGRAESVAIGEAKGITIGEAKGIRDSIREILEVHNEAVAPESLERLEAIADLDHLRRLRKLLFVGGSASDFVQALQGGNGR